MPYDTGIILHLSISPWLQKAFGKDHFYYMVYKIIRSLLKQSVGNGADRKPGNLRIS